MEIFKPETLLLSHEIRWPELPTHPPRDHKHLLGHHPVYWRRVAKVLWLVSSGFSLWKEIQYIVAYSENVSVRSGALYRLLPRLCDNQVLRSILVQLTGKKTLRLVKLGPNSTELIRRLKWQPVENEWERLVRLHEKNKVDEERHTLAVITFAYHARLRGYQAGVMPIVNADSFAPDVEVIQDAERVLVEVERIGYRKFSKWQNMAAYQGFTAFCARTEKHRKRLIMENDWELGISGRATDLQTLFSSSWQPPYGPLWAETW